MISINNKHRNSPKQHTIEQQVIDILAEDERARNSDLWLIILFWRKQGHKVFIPYEAIENGTLTTPESITRARRKIQNTLKLYPPTDPHVADARGIKEEEMRRYYGRR